jgi:hypothetical protein
MFLGVWTLTCTSLFIPLAPKPRKGEHSLIAMAVLDGLTVVFHMCGGISLAAGMVDS